MNDFFERLQVENATLKNEISTLKNRLDSVSNKNIELEALVKHYAEQERLFKARMFGPSSEKTDPAQLSLFNEVEATADRTVVESTFEEVAGHKRKKRTGKRAEMYKDLEIKEIVYELSADEQICPDCKGPFHACGHSVLRRDIEIIPAQVRAVHHIQTTYSCRACEKTAADNPVPMAKSTVPAPVIAGSGVASPSFIAYVLCNKYLLALPLYRQQQELERMGIQLSRETLANWVIYVGEHYFRPLFGLLQAELVASPILHADETTVQVIKENGRSAHQLSYMWFYRTAAEAERPIALFEYQPTREAEHPQKFLADFSGYLHTDAYPAYKPLEKHGVRLVECWAHMRRKFMDTLKSLPKVDRPNAAANTGLDFCNKLFEFERGYDEANLTPQQRHEQRLKESKPAALAFFEWAKSEAEKPTHLPKSTYGKAIIYAVNQEKWLMNVYLDGRLAISNNLAESSIRPFAIGRNNWKFSFSAAGAEASALAYSLVETAKANNLLPFLYFRYLLENLPNVAQDCYHEFLPWTEKVQEACKKPIFSNET